MNIIFLRRIIILLLILICLLLFGTISFSEGKETKNILILNSYHKGHMWTDKVTKGIEDVLKEANTDNVIHVEYMDTKTIRNSIYLEKLYELYKYKFHNYRFDAIIANDNNAYTFLKKYHNNLFPNTPIVVCGLNEYDDFLTKNNSIFTGIAETIAAKDTIDTALEIHQNTKNIVVLLDNSVTGNILKEKVTDFISEYDKEINFHFIQNDYLKYVVQKVQTIPENSIVFHALPVYKGSFGERIGKELGNKMISQATKAPIYSCWESEVGDGFVGGKVISGYNHGKRAANIAMEILNGADVKNIAFQEKSNSNYYFDYNVLKKFDIKLDTLPKESIIINTPPTEITISKKKVYFSATIAICILIIINVILTLNINKRRHIEKELRKEKDTLRAILDSSTAGILVIDKNRKVLHSNKDFAKLWRIPKDVLSSKDDKRYIKFVKDQLVDSEEFYSTVEELTYKECTITDKLKFKDGRILERSSTPLLIDGKVSGRVWVFRDITERQKAEDLKHQMELEKLKLKQAIENDKLKTQFFSTISHELKTPLNVILGTIQLLKAIGEDFEHSKVFLKLDRYINVMKQNCYRLLRLINNLIDITRIDANFFKMNIKNYNIVNIVEDIVLSVDDYVKSHGIKLIFDTDIEEKVIACDVDKIERIILNLLSNAIKFTEENGVISVNILDKGEKISISVKDTGVGIPENKIEEIFDRFKQVDSSFTRPNEGSGIGLSLVKALVELHNGTIRVESKVGSGSEFIIELPTIVVKDEPAILDEINSWKDENVERINIEFSDIYL